MMRTGTALAFVGYLWVHSALGATDAQPGDVQADSQGAKPTIEFTFVPRYGSTLDLEGQIWNAEPEEVGVAVYIWAWRGWWTKPTFAQPLTKVNADGTWMCDITTGGVDHKATAISAFLVPVHCKPPRAANARILPPALDDLAMAKVSVKREPRERAAEPHPVVPRPAGKLQGVCYGPFRDDQDPRGGSFPTVEQLQADVQFLAKVTEAVRTYGVTNSLGKIPQLCQEAGADCYPGAWLSRDEKANAQELQALIDVGKQRLSRVQALIVGSEVLLRGDMSEEALIDCVRQVKKATGAPVTTAETWQIWREHPRLADEVDLVMIHVHPYWEGRVVEEAAEGVLQVFRLMRSTFPNKKILIGETGWPSEGPRRGRAIPSPTNAARYANDFLSLAEAKGVPHFYFEMFDEKWKSRSERGVGAHWGLCKSDGSVKEDVKTLLPPPGREGMRRPSGGTAKSAPRLQP